MIMPSSAKQFSWLRRRHKPVDSVISEKTDADLRRFDLGFASTQCGKTSHRTNFGAAHHFIFVGIASRLMAIAAAGFLSLSVVAVVGKAAPKSQVATSNFWASLIAEASQRFGVPEHWIRAVMQAESAGDKGALSPKGAMGLMQIMPETYAELRLRHRLGADPYAPRNNILAGAAYLREMKDRYGQGGFLAAYNAGPGRYEDYLNRGRPLPEETRAYVAAIAPSIGVPGIPRHSTGGSLASRIAIFAAEHNNQEQAKAPIKSKFSSGISQFDERKSPRSMTLFAMVRSVFEPTAAAAKTIDITALEPTSGRALDAASAAAESLQIHHSKALRPSLIPRGDAQFVTHLTQPIR
jgi:hypothetical protein